MSYKKVENFFKKVLTQSRFFDKTSPATRGNTMAKQYHKGHPINWSSKAGYPTVWVNNKNTLVHRLVWEEHNGEIPDGMDVHHKNGNKHDYSIDNLELISRTEHHRLHALKHGLGKGNLGKPKNHQSGYCGLARAIKLTKGDEVLHFNSVSETARYLDRSPSDVCRVAKGIRNTIHGWEVEYVG